MGIIFGGIRFPLSAATPTVNVADPWLARALPFWQQCIKTYIADAYQAAYPGSKTGPCAKTVSCDPVPFLDTVVLPAPLLAVFPTGGSMARQTLERDQITTDYRVCYVLPAATFDTLDRVTPLLWAVYVLLVGVTEKQSDDSYQSGARVWHEAGTDDVVWQDYEIGFLEDEKRAGHFMPALMATVRVRIGDEYDDTDATAFAGHNAAVGIGDNIAGILDDAIEIETTV